MKSYIASLLLLLLTSFLMACTPEELIGEYVSESGSVIEVRKGGEVTWIPNPEATDEVQFLGIVSVDKKNKSAYLVMQSTNRWIGTNFKYDEKHEKIWVEWKRIDGGEVGSRDTEYTKKY